MSQVFNLRGTPVYKVSEIRTNLITDNTGDHTIIEFDPVANTATLWNVDIIYSRSGQAIAVDNIQTNP